MASEPMASGTTAVPAPPAPTSPYPALRSPMPGATTAVAGSQVPTSPYPGLRSFHEYESTIFFGRDEQVDQLLERLESKRLVAVTGDSGCGKSSLVRAGLLPALRAGLLQGGRTQWRIAELRPGDRPICNLADKLARALCSDSGGNARLLSARLRYGPRSIADILRDFTLPPDTELLIIVDQFEELIRFRERIGRDEADAFVALLLETVADESLPVRVVLTLRTDYLGGCASFAGLPEVLNGCQYLVPRLERRQLRDAIVKPACKFNGVVESTLANQLINEIGQHQDQLPVLEHALLAMWRQARERAGGVTQPGVPGPSVTLTIGDYIELGGIGEALSRHATDVYKKLDGEEKKRIARRLFCALWDDGANGNDTRRPCSVRDAAAIAGVDVARLTQVADAFRRPEHSFLMPPPDCELTADSLLDVSHESLFRHWELLKQWIGQEADNAKQYRFWLTEANQRVRDDGDLLSNKAIERALAWYTEVQPTPAWARRYDEHPDDFENLERFLAESRRARRLRQGIAGSAATLAAIVLGVSVFWLASYREQREQDQRRVELLRQQTYSAAAFGAHLEPVRALQLALEAQGDRDNPQAGTALHAALRASRLRSMVFPSLGTFEDAKFLDDNRIITVGEGDGLGVWDVQTGRRLAAIYDAMPRRLAVHVGTDSTLAATASDDGTVDLWDVSDAKRLKRLWMGRRQVLAITDIAFSPDGLRLATSSEDGTAVLWDVNHGTALEPLVDHLGAVLAVAFSHDSRRVATAGTDGRIVLWDAWSGKKLGPFARGSGAKRLAFDATGRYIAAATGDGVKLWDPITQHDEGSLLGANRVMAIAFNSDGRRIATTALDGTLRVLDTAARKQLFSTSADVPLRDDGRPANELVRSHDDEASWLLTVAFSASGRQLVTTGRDGSAKIWDVDAGGELQTFRAHERAIRRIAYSPDGQRIATASDDGTAALWSLDGTRLQQIPRATPSADPVLALAFNAARTKLAMSTGKRVLLWNLADQTMTIPALEMDDEVRDLQAFHARDRVAVAAGHSVAIWGGATMRPDRTIDTGTTTYAVAVSPDDRMVAGECRDQPPDAEAEFPRQICLWDVDNGARLAVLGGSATAQRPAHVRARSDETHRRPILALQFSPDGTWLASSSDDKTVKIWNVQTRRHLKTLRGHRESIVGLAISPDPDGNLLVTAGSDLVRMWNTSSYITQDGFPDAEYGSDSVAFSPDATAFAAGGHDGVVRVYAVDSDLLRPLARKRTPIHLTDDECSRYAGQPCRDPRTPLQIANEARHLLQRGPNCHGDRYLAIAALREPASYEQERWRFAGAQAIHRAIDEIAAPVTSAVLDATKHTSNAEDGSDRLATLLATAQAQGRQMGEQILGQVRDVDSSIAVDPATLPSRIIALQLAQQADAFARGGRSSWAEQTFLLTPPAASDTHWAAHAALSAHEYATIARVQHHMDRADTAAVLSGLRPIFDDLDAEHRRDHQLVLLRFAAAAGDAADLPDVVRMLGDVLLKVDDVEVLTDFAEFFLRKRQSKRAIAVIDRALALDPTNDLALAQLGEAQRDAGQLLKALNAFRAVSPMAPIYPTAAAMAGAISYDKLERLSEGYRWMGVAIVARDPLTWANLAESAWGNNRLTEARLIASRVVEARAVDPPQLDVDLAMRFVLVAALYQSQDYRAAETALDGLIKLAPRVAAEASLALPSSAATWSYRGDRAAVSRIKSPAAKRFLDLLLTYSESFGKIGDPRELYKLLHEARDAQDTPDR